MKVIWLTKGETTKFEFQYLTEVILGQIEEKELIFDEVRFISDANNSVVIYSAMHGNCSNIDKWLKDYKNYYLIHLSDEELSADTQLYNRAKAVFRSYYNPNLKYNNVYTIPLGFQSGLLNKNGRSNFSQKDIIWTFAGQVKSHRRDMITELSKFTPNYLHITDDWLDPKGLTTNEMSNILNRTLFIPCPFGNVNPESFRIMEGLEHGCIPVVVEFLGEDHFKYTFGNHPFISGKNWRECSDLITYYLNDKVALEEKFIEINEWYSKYKLDLSTDVAAIISGSTEQLKSKQFEIQSSGMSKTRGILYKLYFRKWKIRVYLYRLYKRLI